jgi:hypothetical protein
MNIRKFLRRLKQTIIKLNPQAATLVSRAFSAGVGSHVGSSPLTFKTLIKKGLLGYQPVFFPNGVISGAGYQFFGNLRKTHMRMLASDIPSENVIASDSRNIQVKSSVTFNQGRFGNLYIPAEIGDRSEFDTEFYYCVAEDELEDFVRDNLVLLEMYEYFANSALKLYKEQFCTIDSMIEIGSNTCVFPFVFSKAGVETCHGADIVDYTDVVGVLSEMYAGNVTFHHMQDDSDATWKNLPKADLVWSYAVLLHQSNPLAHLTRLAALAKKAMFIMTLSEPSEWKSTDDLAIRYLSANSYYNADFPNCFDVTIVSPALLKYSLNRLGFSHILEIPNPLLGLLDEIGQSQLNDWMKKHCFYLAMRDAPKDELDLNDYSVATERSPFKGENVLVYEGNYHNIILMDSKYFIVPHGESLVDSRPRKNSQCFSSLTNAIIQLNELATEKTPVPLQVRALRRYKLIRYKKRIYLLRNGDTFDFPRDSNLHVLHSLDSLDKWDQLLALVDEADIQNIQGIVVDCISNFLILRSADGTYSAVPVSEVSERGESPGTILGTSASEIIQKIHGKILLKEMLSSGETLVFPGIFSLYRNAQGRFELRKKEDNEVISTQDSIGAALRMLMSLKA